MPISNNDENERKALKNKYINELKIHSKERQEFVDALEHKSFAEALEDYAKTNTYELIFSVLEKILPNGISNIVKLASTCIVKTINNKGVSQ